MDDSTNPPDASLDSLTDPEELTECDGVDVATDTRVVTDPEEFAGRERWAGMAVVGVVDDGQVLLMDGPHGWTLPVGPVEPGEDWVAAGRRWVRDGTGLAVDVHGIERAARITYRLDGEDRETTGYDVVFRAAPAAGASLDDGDGEWPAGWYEEVPEAVEAHEDILADIRRFVD